MPEDLCGAAGAVRMNSLLSFTHIVPLQIAAAANPALLSEEQLFRQYPALSHSLMILFGLGLLCDVYLFARLTGIGRKQRHGQSALFRVGAPPWGLEALILVIATLVPISIGLGTLAALLARVLKLDSDHSLAVLLCGELLLRGGAIAAFGWYLHRHRIGWTETFGLQPSRCRSAAAWGAVFYLAIVPPLWIISEASTLVLRLIKVESLPQPLAEKLVSSDSSALVALLTGFAVVAAPLFEELFFRGFAYPVLKQRLGTAAALVTVSVVFALIHCHLPSVPQLFALSLGLGVAYEMTGSLLAPIAMHALFNAANVAMLLYVRVHS
jgi:membrane protease YdiL (CAAX protease family)